MQRYTRRKLGSYNSVDSSLGVEIGYKNEDFCTSHVFTISRFDVEDHRLWGFGPDFLALVSSWLIV